MRKLKLFFACLLMAVLSIGQVWATEVEVIGTLNPSSTITLNATATNVNDVLSITGAKGTNNFPVFNYNATNGTDLRFYKGTTCAVTFTVTSSYKIESIVFKKNSTTASSLSNLTANNGTLSSNTWTAGADPVQSVKFTYNNSSNFSGQIYQIYVTYSLIASVDPYTVSFNTGAGNPAVGSKTEAEGGAGITLPAGPTPACSADGWTFAGWAETAVASKTTTAPTLLSGTYHPTENVTLYAVYSQTEGGSGDNGTVTVTYNSTNFPTAYGTANTFTEYTLEGYKFKIQQVYKAGTGDNAKMQWRAAGNSSGTGTIYNTQVFPAKISSIVLTYKSDDNKNHTLKVGNSENPTSGTSITGTTVGDVETFDCSAEDADYFVLANGASAGYTASIAINYGEPATTYYLSAPTCCTPHAITIASGIENGTVEADKTEACEGAEVTLTATPDGSYHFEAWDVYKTGESATKVTVTSDKFTMPDYAVTVSATFAHDACENLAAPTLNGVTKTYNSATIAWTAVTGATGGYAVSVVKDGKSEPVFSGNVDALSKALADLEPETQYNYTIMAVGDGTEKCADGNDLLEGNFTTNPLPEVQLWLVEKQGETAKNGGTHALGVEFDIPASTLECSKVFRGWTTEAYKDYTHATDAPAVLMNKYTFESETAVTLYAVYADETPGAATLTKLNGSSMPVAGDKIVIVGIDTNDDSKHALYQETSGSSYVKHWAFDNNVATVAADAKKYVTLEAANDGKFYLGDATNGYVYSSGSNNLSVDLTNKTAWTIAWDADASAFTFNQGKYLSCRSDLTGDNTYLYRLAGGTPAGIWKLDVYKYGTSASTYSNYATTCSNLLDNPTFSLDPVVAPVNDKYEEAINVVITNNAGEGTIYYTTNGENPTSASDEYTDPITLNTCGTKTIKAIVISATNHSEVVTATYEMSIPIPSVSAEDPYTEAEAVAVYNSGCYNNEDVYVTGTVASAQLYNSGTYTVTLEDGFQFYYLYESYDGENLVPFSSDYIVAGDVLVAKGKLGKHNTTYQIANGYLVSRTPASKTPIDSDIDHPITVAAAVNYIDNAATYDLSEDEFVAGIVESIAECPQHEGTYDIIVLDATDNTKQMKFFGCDVKTFTGIKQYDQITGKGKLFKYNSIYELNYPCEVVALTPYVAPAVSVTGVEVDATASVQVGKTVQLTATVAPEGATNKNVTWSVKEGDEAYAEVSATGLVTGLAEGEATIIVTTEDGGFTDECVVTVNPIPYWATVYTSNVAFVGGGSSYENNSKVVINSNEYDAQKVGASSKTGTVTVTVPAYTHTLHFHVFTWKNQTMTMGVASDDVTNLSAETIDVIGDDGGGASTPYTIEGNPVDHYQYITFEPIATEAQIVFSYSSGGDKRFIMYGINQVGGVLPELDHIVITGTATALEYEVGDVFIPAGLGVDAYYTLAGTPIAEPEHLVVDENWSGWSVDPAILTSETTSVTVTATYEGKQDTKNVDITVNVPETPEIVVNTNAIAFGKVNQNATVDAEGISVTLKAVDAATVTLAGDGAAAFSIDKTALSELNSTIAVTPVTTAVGTFAATVTITDNAGVASEQVINLSMTVEAVEDLTGTWVKATSVAAGDRIIVGATVGEVTKTMGGQNTNNRAAVTSTLADGVLTPAEGTKTFLVVDAGDGKFALQALNGKYLTSATSGTGNNLWEAANYENDNAKWTINIDGEGVASVVAAAGSRTYMKYNNGSTLFSCYQYETSQSPINIYKKGTPSYGSYERDGLTPGNYATICLPNGGTISGAKLFDLEYYDGASTLYLLEVNGNAMVAGRPYIFLPSATTIEVFYTDNANEDAGSFHGLVGSYSQQQVPIGATEEEKNYILYQNAYYLVNSTAYVGENRAYIHMAGVPTEPSTPQVGQAPRRRVAMTVNGTNTATGIDAINASEKPMKLMIDGQIFIIRGEKMYDATGRLVK